MSARSFLRRRLERRHGPRGPRRGRPVGFEQEHLGDDIIEALVRLDGALRDLASGSDGALHGFDPAYFLAPGVPRIRPVLVLLSARAAEAAGDQALHRRELFGPGDLGGADHVAVAAELLHIAVGLHDAALGQRGGRRRRAARRLLGGAVGWLGGNHLTLRALELARHAPAPETVGDMLDTLREINDGQALAQRLRDGRPGTIDDALALADARSGAVFSFACRAGARLVTEDRSVVRTLGRYGRHAGIAWHLADDLWALGLDGDDLVREVAERAAGGRPPLAVALAAQRDPAVADAWRRLARHGDLDLARMVAERVDAAGGIVAERERLLQESWTARRALRSLPPTPQREALDDFVARLAG
ncbi:MAG: polyprenyl synthetase family protein [Alphaproteobacteria bacterium]|nr:polyprenyl synthetase family protein [Alphaproteobacteria bacterium]